MVFWKLVHLITFSADGRPPIFTHLLLTANWRFATTEHTALAKWRFAQSIMHKTSNKCWLNYNIKNYGIFSRISHHYFCIMHFLKKKKKNSREVEKGLKIMLFSHPERRYGTEILVEHFQWPKKRPPTENGLNYSIIESGFSFR